MRLPRPQFDWRCRRQGGWSAYAADAPEGGATPVV